MRRLKEAMLLLIANDGPLGPEWLDHALKGDWADHRECHIVGDFLLVYQVVAPWTPAVNDLGFVEAVDRFGESIVVGVANAADRRLDPRFAQTFRIPD